MTDIYFGLAIVVLVSLGLFAVGYFLTRTASTIRVTWLTAATVLGLVLYIIFLWDNVLLAQLLPFSNLIVIANWFLPAGAFLSGTVWHKLPGGIARKSFYVLGLIAVGVVALLKPLWGTPPQCHDRWANGVCLQTSDISCSAACAATVLRSVGIDADEQEMSRLCLTRDGTAWQGLYRGLKIKTANSDWDVEVFRCSVEQLRERLPGPVIIVVGIPNKADVNPIYLEDYGWTRGEMHSALLYDFLENGNTDMGDPGVNSGREQWSAEDIRVLYRGRGIRLVSR